MGTASLPAAAQPDIEASAAEERLLGGAGEEAHDRDLLPFTRTYGVSGVVTGTLADSTERAGVPPSVMLAALRAWDAAIDVAKPQDGDRFHVSWEQTFSINGDPIGVGRALWLELRPASGAAAAIHRFKPTEGVEQFFLTSGQAAMPPELALPVEHSTVTSRFGLRGNPFARGAAMGPVPRALPLHPTRRQFAGFGPRLFPRLSMHEGVDLAVPIGTPVYAAADGVIQDAHPKAGYGNYVRIDHGDGLATAYGHLSRYAKGIKPGVHVARGELVAFSGNTGRSTGPHLHFEVLDDGEPVDPLIHATVSHLAGADLERFVRQVAEREREHASEAAADD